MTNFKLSDIEIFQTLGQGTFGRVCLARYKDPSQRNIPLALKIMRKADVLKMKQVEHVKQEKTILALMDHPFIVKLHGVSKDNKNLYLLLGYVSGGELFNRLRNESRFSNDVTLFYSVEIITALIHMHKQNIAYRDLKPENLLIDKSGHLRICDFGFAKLVEEKTFTLCGTPEYLAPEIIQGKGHNWYVDWWALGVILYEMLTGQVPFYEDSAYDIYKKILIGKIDFPKLFQKEGRPQYSMDLIKKLCMIDRSRRLGCSSRGPEEVKLHKWFRGVNWNLIEECKIPTPWIPDMCDEFDTSYFDKYPDNDVVAQDVNDGVFDDF